MRLASTHIVNHKSLQNITIGLSENTYTTLIGINDAGKTSVLRSLQLFFDDKLSISKETETSKVKGVSNNPLAPEDFQQELTQKGLPSFDYDSETVYIFIEFIIEKEYTIDEVDLLKPSDHLQWVLHDKKIGDSVHILKTFGLGGDEYYICCDDAKNEDDSPRALWLQTQITLKQIQKDHDIDDSEVRNENSKGTLKNIERAKAIYASLEPEAMWAKFDFKKDRVFFPELSYLDWNISSEQIDQLAATALSSTIDQVIAEAQAIVNAKRGEANEKANTTLSELYQKYSADLPVSITGLSANVDLSVSKKVTELFVNKNHSNDRVHVSDQGDGVKRQIGLGLIKAIAEEKIEENCEETKFIWCMDEPETHLYPQAQRELALNLQKLSSANFQILVSTHSLTFVDRSQLKDVHRIELVDGHSHVTSTDDPEDALNILDIRGSDFLFSDRFIAVEGPTEYHLLDHMYRLAYGVSLLDDGVKKINLGGQSNMSHYKKILEDLLRDYRKIDDSVVYLLDKDTGSQQSNVVLIGDTADFEDSLSNDVWKNVLASKCGVSITDEELESIRKGIDPADPLTKIHSKLKKHVKDDPGRLKYLSSKGETLALELKGIISSVELVPECILEAFRKIRGE